MARIIVVHLLWLIPFWWVGSQYAQRVALWGVVKSDLHKNRLESYSCDSVGSDHIASTVACIVNQALV